MISEQHLVETRESSPSWRGEEVFIDTQTFSNSQRSVTSDTQLNFYGHIFLLCIPASQPILIGLESMTR